MCNLWQEAILEKDFCPHQTCVPHWTYTSFVPLLLTLRETLSGLLLGGGIHHSFAIITSGGFLPLLFVSKCCFGHWLQKRCQALDNWLLNLIQCWSSFSSFLMPNKVQISKKERIQSSNHCTALNSEQKRESFHVTWQLFELSFFDILFFHLNISAHAEKPWNNFQDEPNCVVSPDAQKCRSEAYQADMPWAKNITQGY